MKQKKESSNGSLLIMQQRNCNWLLIRHLLTAANKLNSKYLICNIKLLCNVWMEVTMWWVHEWVSLTALSVHLLYLIIRINRDRFWALCSVAILNEGGFMLYDSVCRCSEFCLTETSGWVSSGIVVSLCILTAVLQQPGWISGVFRCTDCIVLQLSNLV